MSPVKSDDYGDNLDDREKASISFLFIINEKLIFRGLRQFFSDVTTAVNWRTSSALMNGHQP